MNNISKASDEISEFISNINEIAKQTKLLALNASIEASRAAEESAASSTELSHNAQVLIELIEGFSR